MALTPITNHVQQGLAKLIEYYKRKPVFAAWCATHLMQVQTIEDSIATFKSSLDVDTCDLTRLRLFGKIVGQVELGLVEQFRLYVKVRILVNKSDGRSPTLIKIARILLGNIRYTNWGQGSFEIEALDPIGIRNPDVSAELLNDARVGGVRSRLVFSNDALEGSFSFAPGTASIADGRGFSDYANTTGGTLARIR
jgi:hypothetical protein